MTGGFVPDARDLDDEPFRFQRVHSAQTYAEVTQMRAESTGLQAFLDRETAGYDRMRILEAGCGSRSNIRFDEGVRWTGIDISAKQLERNSGLHEKIQGDLQVHRFEPASFDMIVCWDVLEHLDRPPEALQRFADSIAPNGLIVLKVPNLDSMKGRLTRILGHGVHVAWYKYLYGRERIQQADGGPFPTYLRDSVAPRELRRFASQAGLEVAFESYYDFSTAPQVRRRKLFCVLYLIAKTVAGALSFGRLGDSEYIIVLRKPA